MQDMIPRLLTQAGAAMEAQRFAEAEQLFRAVLQMDAQEPHALFGLGAVALAAGALPDAIDLIGRAVKKQPKNALWQLNLGDACRYAGNVDEALNRYERAAKLEPGWWLAHNNVGAARMQKQDYLRAVVAFRQAVRCAPDNAMALTNLGGALEQALQRPEAITCYRKAVAANPDYWLAWNNLGASLIVSGRFGDAIAPLEEAIRRGPPDQDKPRENLALALEMERRFEEAIPLYRELITRAPAARLYKHLTDSLAGQQHYVAAEGTAREGLTCFPEDVNLRIALANMLLNQARVMEAMAEYRRACAADTSHREAAMNLAFALNYVALEGGEVRATAEKVGASLLEKLPKPKAFALSRDPSRRLRVGFVSPDFRNHSVAFFMEAVLAGLPRDAVEVFAYPTHYKDDAVTARLQPLADHWVSLHGKEDEAAVATIQNDRIDVLVDVAGFTVGERLAIFARRAAPVQVSYLGYPATTGLATMDWRITDAIADPEGVTDAWFTERLLRLPRPFLCYTPRAEAPELADLPAKTAGVVTFGSFNNLAKLSEATLDLWARVLSAVPGSRLVMKNAGLVDAEVREAVATRFEAKGVARDRLSMMNWAATGEDHLALYGQVDIGLDTFPYNGTTTTCEALWQGVPTLTLAGRVHAARVGASIMSAVKLADFVTETEDIFVARAVELAQDLDRLADLRAGMRTRMRGSPLMDVEGMGHALAGAFRRIWREWCAGSENKASKPASALVQSAEAQSPRWVEMVGGIHVCVPPSVDYMTTYILLEQEDWMEDEIQFVRGLLHAGEKVVDIGANHGVYTLTAARCVGESGQVIAFEPDHQTAARLARSIERNGFANVHLHRLALSRQAGHGVMVGGDQSELLSLERAEGDTTHGQTVRIETLDSMWAAEGCPEVSFVKMDAEGEEAAIVEGGQQFFGRGSPLVMFELKHGDAFNDALLSALGELEYGFYRLVPGAGLLLPWKIGEPLDSYALNLFACKPDRARGLEADGRLVSEVQGTPAVALLTMLAVVDQLPFARIFRAGWRKASGSTGGEADYATGLAHWLRACDADGGPSVRLAHLWAAQTLIERSIQKLPSQPRRMMLAQVERAVGHRKNAVALWWELKEEGLDPAAFEREPFVPPEPYSKQVPHGNIGAWLKAVVVSELEKAGAFSSYYAGTGTLIDLEWLASTSWATPEMERRRQLVRLRAGLQEHPEPTPRLGGSRNPDFWAGR